MLELALAAGVLLLCHLGRGSSAETAPKLHVDRLELNHYTWSPGCESHQVILWQWSESQLRYLPIRFFFVPTDGSRDPYRVGNQWRFRHRDVWGRRPDLVIEANELIVTQTDYDPWKESGPLATCPPLGR